MWALGRLFKMLRGGKRDRDFTWETILFSKERSASITAILGNRREVAFFGKATALRSILMESDSSLSRLEKGNKRNEKGFFSEMSWSASSIHLFFGSDETGNNRGKEREGRRGISGVSGKCMGRQAGRQAGMSE